MHGTNVSRWLNNKGAGASTRLGDLGCFVGYRNAEACYTKTPDKRAALRDIIEAKNVATFLARSGYAPTATLAGRSDAERLVTASGAGR